MAEETASLSSSSKTGRLYRCDYSAAGNPMASSAENKADDWLRKATEAASSGARAKYATRGLAKAGTDPTLRAMLLRQLYLSQMELEHFEAAQQTARAALELGVLPDVACQDLARARRFLIGRGGAADEDAAPALRVDRKSVV